MRPSPQLKNLETMARVLGELELEVTKVNLITNFAEQSDGNVQLGLSTICERS